MSEVIEVNGFVYDSINFREVIKELLQSRQDLQEQLKQSREYINTLHTMIEQYSDDIETLKARNEKLERVVEVANTCCENGLSKALCEALNQLNEVDDDTVDTVD